MSISRLCLLLAGLACTTTLVAPPAVAQPIDPGAWLSELTQVMGADVRNGQGWFERP